MKSTVKHASVDVEEAFLLESLRRLHKPQVRYIFTLMADVLSHGLVAQAEKRKRATKK